MARGPHTAAQLVATAQSVWLGILPHSTHECVVVMLHVPVWYKTLDNVEIGDHIICSCSLGSMRKVVLQHQHQ